MVSQEASLSMLSWTVAITNKYIRSRFFAWVTNVYPR